jgi:hypothetical protein
MSKGGYVDSSRRVRSLHRQQDDLQISKHRASPTRGGLLASINKSSRSAPVVTTTPIKRKGFDKNVSSSANLEHKIKEYDKTMRVIEVCRIDCLNQLI